MTCNEIAGLTFSNLVIYLNYSPYSYEEILETIAIEES